MKFICDDGTIWTGINPRGCYIDLMRDCDNRIIEKNHSASYKKRSDGLYDTYKNKTTYPWFIYRQYFKLYNPPTQSAITS